jgi:pimeloyl-ACP methyl ester carboxylesterase
VLIGSSFGGGVALLQAATDPANVLGLVLSGSMLPAAPGSRRAQRNELFRRRLRQRGSDVLVGARAIRAGQLRRGGLQEYLLRGNAAVPARMDPATVRAILAQPRRSRSSALRTTIRAGFSSLRLMTDPIRFTTIIDSIAAPVLIIHGDRDRTVPVAQATAVGRARPDWRVETFDGVGHLPHLDDPARWSAAVEDWWSVTARAFERQQ